MKPEGNPTGSKRLFMGCDPYGAFFALWPIRRRAHRPRPCSRLSGV